MAKNLPPVPPLTSQGFNDPVWARWLNLLRDTVAEASASFAIVTANGFSGNTTVVGGQTQVTLSVSVSGVLKGQGGAIVPAVAGTDYVAAIAASAPLTVSGTSTRTIAIPAANTSTSGYLTSGDWNTFNSKLTGNQTITVTGDATGSGTTAIGLTLAASGVTAGTYGSGSVVPQVTVDAKGRVTGVTNIAVAAPWAGITGKPTTATGYGIATIDAIPIGGTTPAAGAFTTLSSTGLFTPKSNVGIAGTTAADSPASGSVGENVAWTSGTSVTLPNAGTATTIQSFVIPAGDWIVNGVTHFVPSATAVMNGRVSGLSLTPATLGPLGTRQFWRSTIGPGLDEEMLIPPLRVNVAVPTAVYIVAAVVITGSGTPTCTAISSYSYTRAR